MPLLTRMLTAPLSIDVRRGAIVTLGELLKDRRIATEGRVAVAVGPGQGDAIAADLSSTLGLADIFRVGGGTVDAAVSLGSDLRSGSYEALIGIGGGKTIDVAKYAATLAGIPMVSVATNLSHDGICSPVASLEHEKGKGSFGVAMPIAMVVDLDYVRAAPERLVRSGIGDVISNLSAIEDWELSHTEQSDPIDRLAVTMARMAAEAVLYQPESIESDEFLTVLAESLVMSGMAMSFAGSSRPCSGGCHEILHAIDHHFGGLPGAGNHGELAGIGALFCFHLRTQFLGDKSGRARTIAACLRKHELPLVPEQVGLSEEQFAEAVTLAPAMRPGRYTILEHLALDERTILKAVGDYVREYGR